MADITLNNINFSIDNNLYKGWTINNGYYFLNQSILTPNDDNILKLDTDKISNIIEKNRIDKLQNIHAITINWGNADLSDDLGEEFSSINNTGQLLAAIVKASKMGASVTITVDNSLDINSENPVQNKVVAQEFSDLEEAIADLANTASEKMADWE